LEAGGFCKSLTGRNRHLHCFYLWAVLAAVSVLERSDDPAVQSFIDRPWPLMPTHWQWVPARIA
jgi:hypothetical protein